MEHQTGGEKKIHPPSKRTLRQRKIAEGIERLVLIEGEGGFTWAGGRSKEKIKHIDLLGKKKGRKEGSFSG